MVQVVELSLSSVCEEGEYKTLAIKTYGLRVTTKGS